MSLLRVSAGFLRELIPDNDTDSWSGSGTQIREFSFINVSRLVFVPRRVFACDVCGHRLLKLLEGTAGLYDF
jgi:hypothetical protein